IEAGDGEADRGLLAVVDGGVADGQRQVGADVGIGVEVDGGAIGAGGVAGVVGDVGEGADRSDGEARWVGAEGAVGLNGDVDVVDGVSFPARRASDLIEAGDGEADRGLLAVVDGGVADGQRQVGADVGIGVEVDGGAIGAGGVAGVVGDV